MTTILGLFDNGENLQEALNALAAAGFEDDFQVVDPTRPDQPSISDETFFAGVGLANAPINSGRVAAFPFVVPGFADPNNPNTGDQLLGLLGDYNLTTEEKDFFAERLQRGGKLLIVKTEAEHADFVREVLRRHHASNWTGSANR